MPTSFYDVVVLGTHLEPLLCAALLGREGLRVLVLGQGVPDPSYMLGGVEVEPYGLSVTGVQSPVVQSTLELLALRQDLRQRMMERDDVFQLLLAKHRIEVYPETDRWLAELGRELPSVKHQATDITRTLGEVKAELDMVVGRGLTWPPESFLERQRLSLVASAQRYDRQGQGWTSWNQLAHRHPLRMAFEAALPHVSGLLPGQHSDATRARLHGHMLEGVTELPGGWRWFREALFGRIRSWGGDVRAREPLLELMVNPEEESLRIKHRIAEGFADTGWVVKGYRGTVEKLLAEHISEFHVDGKGRIKRKKVRK